MPYSGSGSPRSWGMMNQNQKITMTSGTPRKNSTYITAGTRIQAALASRARPTAMPRAKPSTIAGMARRSVPPAKLPRPRKPWTIRNLKLWTMTPRSSIARSARPADTRDEAGDRVAPLQCAHDPGDAHAEHEVDQRARRQGLEGPGRVRLDLPRLERQLGHADRQRHRRVLEQVQRLVGDRRHDQAERDGHDDEPIRLPDREAHRDGRLELGARNRQDAGADHLGHARAVVHAQREHPRPELGAVIEEPVLYTAGQEWRHAEVPEEHPHEQRDVTEEFDVENRGRPQWLERHRAECAGQDPEHDGEEPRQSRQLQRRDEALEQPVAGLAGPEHAPLELVAHARVRRPATCRSASADTPSPGATSDTAARPSARTTCRRSRSTCPIRSPA